MTNCYIRSLLFGLVMDVLREGLRPELREQLQRIAVIKEGQIEEMLNRCVREEEASVNP